MKKYIEPNTRCIDIELESLIADSPNNGGMTNGTGLTDDVNYGPQLVKEQNSFGDNSLWDNEW